MPGELPSSFKKFLERALPQMVQANPGLAGQSQELHKILQTGNADRAWELAYNIAVNNPEVLQRHEISLEGMEADFNNDYRLHKTDPQTPEDSPQKPVGLSDFFPQQSDDHGGGHIPEYAPPQTPEVQKHIEAIQQNELLEEIKKIYAANESIEDRSRRVDELLSRFETRALLEDHHGKFVSYLTSLKEFQILSQEQQKKVLDNLSQQQTKQLEVISHEDQLEQQNNMDYRTRLEKSELRRKLLALQDEKGQFKETDARKLIRGEQGKVGNYARQKALNPVLFIDSGLYNAFLEALAAEAASFVPESISVIAPAGGVTRNITQQVSIPTAPQVSDDVLQSNGRGASQQEEGPNRNPRLSPLQKLFRRKKKKKKKEELEKAAEKAAKIQKKTWWLRYIKEILIGLGILLLALLIAFLLALIIELILSFLSSLQQNTTQSTPIPGLDFNGTDTIPPGKLVFKNGENISYLINVNYTGSDSITIVDTLPVNANLITSSLTGKNKVSGTQVTWLLDANPPLKDSTPTKKHYQFKITLSPLGKNTHVVNTISAVYTNGGPATTGTPPGSKPSAGGYCSPSNLAKYFGSTQAGQVASCICKYESGGDPGALNSACLRGGTADYSVGLFQMNLLAHCPGALNYNGKFCSVRDSKLLSRCKVSLMDPTNNIQAAANLYKNEGHKWTPGWNAERGKCF